MVDVLTELHGKELGLDEDRALVIRSGVIRSADGSSISFPDGIDFIVGSGTTSVEAGGTGFTSYTTGDILYASGATTFAKLSTTGVGYALRVSSGGVPEWGLLSALGTVSLGTWQATAIGAPYGGTGQTSYVLGDILYASGTTSLSKLSVGREKQVLTSSGTAPVWSDPIIAQNAQSANYTLTLTDGGGHIYHPSADTTARQWTIPNNATVPFTIGTAVTFINDTSAGAITIAMVSDTLVMAGTGSTGSRTLAANGVATAIKVAATRWIISGTGLT